MGLFGLGKKKDKTTKAQEGCCSATQEPKKTCCCGDKKPQARIITLGACCKKSQDSFANVKTAALELGLTEEVINIGDMAEIAKYGVMSMPGLVIDGKVVSVGKFISVEDAKEMLKKAGF